MKKLLASSAFVAFAALVPLFSAHALTISPARLEISADPGQTVTGEFLLINEQADTKTFYSSAQNFEAQGETGTPSFVDAKDGLASWIKVVPQITLKKDEQQKVSFTITVPKDADAGGHFAAIFLSTAPAAGGGAQVSVGAKVGVLILLHVSGDIKVGGGILGFSTADSHRFYTTLPIGFLYRFSNTGNDRVSPGGSLVIRDSLGLKTAEIPANPDQGNILPGSVRRFEVDWGTDAPLAPGTGFFAAAGYEWSHFAFGWYRATLGLTYGATSGSAHADLFVFPWQLLLIALVMLAVIGWVLFSGLRRYNRWIISMAQAAR